MPTSDSILASAPDIVPISIRESAVTADSGTAVLVVGVVGDGDDLEIVADGLAEDVVAELTSTARLLGAGSKVGTVTTVPAPAGTGAATVILVGVGGDADPEISDESLRRASGAAARSARGEGTTVFALDSSRPEAVATGAGLGAYKPKKVTGSDENSDDGTDHLVVVGSAGDVDAARVSAIVESVAVARDFVNTPPNLLFPESFADRAAELGRAAGLEVEVLDEVALRDGGYGGITSVGQGSSRPPRLLRMTHRGGEDAPRIALVGKGITFDTGGISIKPAAGMEQMTMDMGGAAAVVATVLLAARVGLGATVTATVPMAENMPSATAYRPGDVITHYGGKTVEVQNTDAEGRLVLADAIVRACEDDPDFLIDTATLTGAQMVALGKLTPGVMGHDEFRDRVAELSRSVGEDGWPMPLPEELREALDSNVADLTHVTPHRWGGMLSAGIFLREFVADGVEWAHIDVAGPAYNDSPADGYRPKGATGVPVRTMFAVLEDIAGTGR